MVWMCEHCGVSLDTHDDQKCSSIVEGRWKENAERVRRARASGSEKGSIFLFMIGAELQCLKTIANGVAKARRLGNKQVIKISFDYFDEWLLRMIELTSISLSPRMGMDILGYEYPFEDLDPYEILTLMRMVKDINEGEIRVAKQACEELPEDKARSFESKKIFLSRQLAMVVKAGKAEILKKDPASWIEKMEEEFSEHLSYPTE